MKINTEKIDDLTPEKRKGIMERSMEDISVVFEDVRGIVNDIKAHGDTVTLAHYRKHKEDIAPSDLEATREEIVAAYNLLDPKVVGALKAAARNIIKFHTAQKEREMWSIEVAEGILAGRITRAMDIVGCYIPGGTAVYPSSILMTVLPAKVAGVGEVVGGDASRQGHDGQCRHPGGGGHRRLRPYFQGGRSMGRSRPCLWNRDHAPGG